MTGSDKRKRVVEPVVRRGSNAARFFEVFVHGFIGTLKAKVIDGALALLVLIYQVSRYKFSIEGWRANAWAVVIPCVWLACGIAVIHISRSALVVCRETVAQSGLIEIPGRVRVGYQPQMRYDNAKIWGGSAVACLILVMLSYLVYSYGHLQSAQPSSTNKMEPPALAPPTITSVAAGTEIPVTYEEKKLKASQAISPCTLQHREIHSFDELGSLPGGQGLKKPWLVAKPLRVLIEQRQVLTDRQLSTPPDSDDLWFELSATNGGEPTVAKDWVRCLVQEGKPRYFKPYEIPPYDQPLYGNKVFIEQATAAAPIERGQLVAGWIFFACRRLRLREVSLGA